MPRCSGLYLYRRYRLGGSNRTDTTPTQHHQINLRLITSLLNYNHSQAVSSLKYAISKNIFNRKHMFKKVAILRDTSKHLFNVTIVFFPL